MANLLILPLSIISAPAWKVRVHWQRNRHTHNTQLFPVYFKTTRQIQEIAKKKKVGGRPALEISLQSIFQKTKWFWAWPQYILSEAPPLLRNAFSRQQKESRIVFRQRKLIFVPSWIADRLICFLHKRWGHRDRPTWNNYTELFCGSEQFFQSFERPNRFQQALRGNLCCISRLWILFCKLLFSISFLALCLC